MDELGGGILDLPCLNKSQMMLNLDSVCVYCREFMDAAVDSGLGILEFNLEGPCSAEWIVRSGSIITAPPGSFVL